MRAAARKLAMRCSAAQLRDWRYAVNMRAGDDSRARARARQLARARTMLLRAGHVTARRCLDRLRLVTVPG